MFAKAPSGKARIWTSRLGFGPQGWVLGLKAGFWAPRLRIGPQDWDMGLKAGIWARRLGYYLGNKFVGALTLS